VDLTRREALLALLAAGFGGAPLQARAAARPRALVPDPAGLLDLPAGFSYRVLSRAGEAMDDGLLVPGQHDGMGAFARADGRVVLVRNHEIGIDTWDPALAEPLRRGLATLDPALVYDAGRGGTHPLGGTTTLVFDPARGRLERHFMSLAGTLRNCSGGVTPWGSWVSCEEDLSSAGAQFARNHGYAFEVPSAATGLVAPHPLRALGRFNHEGIAVDPASGCAYETEDRPDGLLYRFLPERRGDLRAGRLQALRLRDRPAAQTHNRPPAPPIPLGERLAVEWVDLANVDGAGDDLRRRGASEHGAAAFMRGEGIVRTPSGIVFTCTIGGPAGFGQIWRYRPSPFEGRREEQREPGTLELLYESGDADRLRSPDNLVACPWGGLLVCEDAPQGDRLIHVDARGNAVPFARNAASDEELTGACFSPDGAWLFVNVQGPGATFAIRGPWKTWAAGS
jgi:secreted PhoX family phosphatase